MLQLTFSCLWSWRHYVNDWCLLTNIWGISTWKTKAINYATTRLKSDSFPSQNTPEGQQNKTTPGTIHQNRGCYNGDGLQARKDLSSLILPPPPPTIFFFLVNLGFQATLPIFFYNAQFAESEYKWFSDQYLFLASQVIRWPAGALEYTCCPQYQLSIACYVCFNFASG